MKKMKSKWLALFVAAIMIVAVLPNIVFAAGTGTGVAKIGEQTYNTIAEAITAAGTNATTIELTQNVTEDVTIPQDANITLQIPQGITLTNAAGHTITNNGTLTVTGAGTVDSVIHQKGALVNNGTATLEGATFTRSQEASTSTTANGGNSWYVIDNHGAMTIKGTANVTNTGYYSSLVRSVGTADAAASLKISSNATLQQDNFIAVKNDDYSNLSITGGTITSNDQAVQNWSQAAISGGTLNGSVITWSYAGFASTTNIFGSPVINGDVKAVNYDGGSSIPTVTIRGGLVTGEVSKGTYSNGIQAAAPDAISSSIVIGGGGFTNLFDESFLEPGFIITPNEYGSYSVGAENPVPTPDQPVTPVQPTGNYQIVEGMDAVWNKGNGVGLTVTANGAFEKFTGILVDGAEVAVENYEAVSGSTVVTLHASYLETLAEGAHTLTVVYTDGEAST